MIVNNGITVWSPDEITFSLVDQVLGDELLLGLDTETYALSDTKQWGSDFGLRTVQVATRSEALVFDVTDQEQLSILLGVLGLREACFVSHTAVDIKNLFSGLGVWIGNRTLDTHLLAKMINPEERGSAGLKGLVEERLPQGSMLTEAEELWDQHARELAPVHHRVGEPLKRFKWGCLPVDDPYYVWYGGLDAVFVRRLADSLMWELTGQRGSVINDHRLYAIVQAASIQGIHVDVDLASKIRDEYAEKIQAGDQVVKDLLGFPARSPKLAGYVDAAAQELGLDLSDVNRSAKTGALSLDAVNLPKIMAQRPSQRPEEAYDDILLMVLDAQEAQAPLWTVLEAREAVSRHHNTKVNLENFLKHSVDGVIRPNVKISQARTTRWSITEPALQTLKKNEMVEDE